jgi:hypothetical protein
MRYKPLRQQRAALILEMVVTTRDEKRRAAVREHEERIVAADKRKADAEAARLQEEQKIRRDRETWMTKAVHTIRAGVQASGEGFARQGCIYVAAPGYDTSPDSVPFRIVPSGRPAEIATEFSFAL